MFPRERYARAGASPEEIDTLQRRFEALPDNAQRSDVARIAAISDYDLAEELATWRDHYENPADEPGKDEGGTAEPGDTPAEEEASQGDAGPEPDTVLGVTEPQTVAEVEAQAEDVPAEVPPATPDPAPGFATGGPVPGPGSVVAGNDGPAAVIPPQ